MAIMSLPVLAQRRLLAVIILKDFYVVEKLRILARPDVFPNLYLVPPAIN